MAGNNDVFFLPDGRPGRVAEVCAYCGEVEKYGRRLYGRGRAGIAHLFAAEAVNYVGDAAAMRENCVRAIHQAGQAGQHDILANVLYLQLRAALFAWDAARALALLQGLEAYADEHDLDVLYRIRDCAAALYHLCTGDATQIPSWLTGTNLATDMPLEIGRDWATRAFCRYALGDRDGAYTLLLSPEDIFPERGLWGLRVFAHLLKALCLLDMADPTRALGEFFAAFDMTWQNGITTCFAEYVNAALSLIDAAEKREEYGFDGERCCSTFRTASPGRRSPPLWASLCTG